MRFASYRIASAVIVGLFLALCVPFSLVKGARAAEADDSAATTNTDAARTTVDRTKSSDGDGSKMQSSGASSVAATTPGSDKTGTTKNQQQQQQQQQPLLKDLEVIQLNSRNFGKHLSDGNVWLIEFYSPGCIHCVEFDAIYADIAKQYHANRALKLKVAKVNGQVEYALVSRFNVQGYPSFFIVDGWRVYHFQQSRTKKLLMSYAEGGYKSTDSIPFYASPMGPLGILQGLLLWTGHGFLDVFSYMQNTLGLSPIIVGSILFGSMFLGFFFFIVFLALVIPPRQKID